MIALHRRREGRRAFAPNVRCWIRHCINIVTREFISDNNYTDNYNSLKPQINDHFPLKLHHLYYIIYIYIWMHEQFKERSCTDMQPIIIALFVGYH